MTPAANTPPCCARCRRPLRPPAPRGGPPVPRQHGIVVAVRSWPEGPICSGCYAKACETYGTCPGCGTDRLLPGRDDTGQPVCTDCAGGIGNFTCTRCGREGWNHLKGVCGRCVLRDLATAALADDTGQINPDLASFLEYLCAMPRPRTGILWLHKTRTQRLLHSLAVGEVPPTHEGLATLQPYKAVAHLRGLLIAAGVLPDVDPTLERTWEWAREFLEGIDDPGARRILGMYSRWCLQRRLNTDAAGGRLHPYRDQNNRHQLRQADRFLTWLRQHDRNLRSLDQAHVDHWFTTAPASARADTMMFLRWAVHTRRAPHLLVPVTRYVETTPLSQADRLRWLHRAACDDRLPGLDRVVLILMLLYAQPVPRITQLRVDDFTCDAKGRLRIRLGTPPVPVPEPFDTVICDYLDHHRAVTVGNPGSPWLFPGRRGSLPLHPTSIRLRLHALGLQPRAARAGTLRQLVSEAPPAIIGEMLGYRPTTAERQAKTAGSTWSRYAALRAPGGSSAISNAPMSRKG